MPISSLSAKVIFCLQIYKVYLKCLTKYYNFRKQIITQIRNKQYAVKSGIVLMILKWILRKNQKFYRGKLLILSQESIIRHIMLRIIINAIIIKESFIFYTN